MSEYLTADIKALLSDEFQEDRVIGKEGVAADVSRPDKDKGKYSGVPSEDYTVFNKGPEAGHQKKASVTMHTRRD